MFPCEFVPAAWVGQNCTKSLTSQEEWCMCTQRLCVRGPASFLNFKPKQHGPVNAKPTRHVAICCMPQTAIAFQPLRNERKPRIMLRIWTLWHCYYPSHSQLHDSCNRGCRWWRVCCSGKELFRDIQTLTLFIVSQLAVASSQLSHYQAANLNNCITIWINLNFSCRGNSGQCPQQQVLHPERLTVWEGSCFVKVGAKRMANSVGHCLFSFAEWLESRSWDSSSVLQFTHLFILIFVDVVIIVIIVFLFFPWIYRMLVIFWKVTCYFTSVARCSEDQYLHWGWCWWCRGLEIVTVDGTMFFVFGSKD